MSTISRQDLICVAQDAGFSFHDGILTGGASDLERFATRFEAHVMRNLTRAKIADCIEIMLEEERKAIIELAEAHLGGDHQGLLNDIRARNNKDDVL